MRAAGPTRRLGPALAGVCFALLEGLGAAGCSRPAPVGGDGRRGGGSHGARRLRSRDREPSGSVTGRQDVPLTGFRVDARPGDWLLENEGQVAVVDAHGGRIVDFGSTGNDDALVGDRADRVPRASTTCARRSSRSGLPPSAPLVVRIERRVHDVPLRLWTFVSFAGHALRIESVATSEGDAAAPVTIGEKVGWGNVPTWVAGSGLRRPAAERSRATSSRARAWARPTRSARQGGRVIGRFNAPQAGFHERAHTGEDAVARRRRGSFSRGGSCGSRTPRAPIGDAAVELLRAEGVALAAVDACPASARSAPWRRSPRARTRASPAGAPFARFALAADPRQTSLPGGVLPHARDGSGLRPEPVGARPATPDAVADLRPRAGRLRWHVTDRGGGPLPARLVVRGIPPTPDPDWGDDPLRRRRARSRGDARATARSRSRRAGTG